MVVGRDERDMKVRKEILPRWDARHRRKRTDRWERDESQQSSLFEVIGAGRQLRSDSYS